MHLAARGLSGLFVASQDCKPGLQARRAVAAIKLGVRQAGFQIGSAKSPETEISRQEEKMPKTLIGHAIKRAAA